MSATGTSANRKNDGSSKRSLWYVQHLLVYMAQVDARIAYLDSEQIQYTMPKAMEHLFEDIMREPLGYVAIGIVSAVAEEVVFRGAVLRRLLDMSDERWHWAAIIASALIFGGVHGNVPQFIHAALMGLILGWMYYRTRSIIPGIVFHCVNNTVAYVMFNLLPQMNDGKLIDLFHGNERLMWMGLLCSMLIFLPALLQLNLRLKRAE